MVVKSISRFETHGEQAGERRATFDWERQAPANMEMHVSSGGLHLTPRSIHLHQVVVHLLPHQVAPTLLLGQISRARPAATLKATIGALPVDNQAVAGTSLGERSQISATTMATVLKMRAAHVVVVQAVLSCE